MVEVKSYCPAVSDDMLKDLLPKEIEQLERAELDYIHILYKPYGRWVIISMWHFLSEDDVRCSKARLSYTDEDFVLCVKDILNSHVDPIDTEEHHWRDYEGMDNDEFIRPLLINMITDVYKDIMDITVNRSNQYEL